MPTVTQTIASSGADFASPAAAASAFVAGTGITSGDDRVYNITQNAAFDSTFLLTANGGAAASATLTVDPSVRHTGFYGTGARLAISTVVQRAIQRGVTSFSLAVEWLEITVTGSGKISIGIDPGSFGSGTTYAVRNCLIHGNGSPTTTPFRAVGIGSNANDGAHTCPGVVLNTVVANWKSASTVAACGIGRFSGGTGSLTVAACTVDDIDVTGGTAGAVVGVAINNAATSVVKNCVVTQIGANTTTGTKACFSTAASATTANNASSDSTAPGTGSLTNIVRANNFNSPGTGDFRPLNNSAPIFAAGANLGSTPTGVDIDLTGRNRTTNGDTWSIGAYQVSASGGVANSITITAPTAYRIYQRSAGTANVTVSGTYGGTVTNVEYRIGSGSWATLQSSPTGGTYSGTVSVPTGVNSISVRFSNDTATTATVSNVLVGDVFLVIGQSNGDGRFTNAQTFTAAGGITAAVFDPDDTAWRLMADPTNRTASGGTAWPLVATQFVADRGVPVGFICAAEGGTSLSQWTTGSAAAAKYTAAKARVTLAAPGGLAAVLWDQGESDAIAATPTVTYKAGLDWLIADVQSTYACPFIVAQTGTEPNGGTTAAALDAVRKAQQQSIAGTTGAKQGPLGYDRANEHWTTDGEATALSGRWWAALKAALYGGTDAHGPRVSSASLNGARTQITVVFDRSLKTGLTFATAPWAVSDGGTPATVSAVNYSGTNAAAVVLTLSGALAGAAGTCTVTFASGNTAAGLVVPKSADVSMPSGSAIQLPAEPFYAQAVGESSSISTTETTLERGVSGQTLHVVMSSGTSTSIADWTIAVGASAGSVTAINSTVPASPVLTVLAPPTSGTATLTHVPSGATCTLTVQDTVAPAVPTGLGRGSATYAFTLSWAAVNPSPAGETITYDVRKNGSTVSTGQSGTSYAVTGAADGDVYGVRAKDGDGNTSAWTDYTFSAPTGVVPVASDVRLGVPVGVTTGTLVVPAASAVLDTVTYDTGTVGTYKAATVAQVRSGVAFGPGSGLTGTYTVALPLASDVAVGVTYGSPQESRTGTYVGGSAPTAEEIAVAWGSRVIGNGRTADMYLQGLVNRIEFDENGTTGTLYGPDDTTPLTTFTATRLGDSVNGLRGFNPSGGG